jgi:hypothetical protein
MFTAEEIRTIEQIVESKLSQMGLSRKIGQVAEVSGDATNGYFARLYINGSSSSMTAPVRCLRHYTPAVGDRVSVLCMGNTILEVLGKVN